MEDKVKTRTPAAIDYANRAIALKWAPENLRSFIEGTFQAAYIAGRIDKGKESHNSNPAPVEVQKEEGKEYKRMEDHLGIKYVPAHYDGYDNPYVEVTLKRGKYDETHEKMLKSCIAEALLRFGALSQIPFKTEIKP